MSTLVGFGLGLTLGGCFGMLVMAVLVVDDDRDERLQQRYDTLYQRDQKRGDLLAELYPFMECWCLTSCPFDQECYPESGMPRRDCSVEDHYRKELANVGVSVDERTAFDIINKIFRSDDGSES